MMRNVRHVVAFALTRISADTESKGIVFVFVQLQVVTLCSMTWAMRLWLPA